MTYYNFFFQIEFYNICKAVKIEIRKTHRQSIRISYFLWSLFLLLLLLLPHFFKPPKEERYYWPKGLATHLCEPGAPLRSFVFIQQGNTTRNYYTGIVLG